MPKLEDVVLRLDLVVPEHDLDLVRVLWSQLQASNSLEETGDGLTVIHLEVDLVVDDVQLALELLFEVGYLRWVSLTVLSAICDLYLSAADEIRLMIAVELDLVSVHAKHGVSTAPELDHLQVMVLEAYLREILCVTQTHGNVPLAVRILVLVVVFPNTHPEIDILLCFLKRDFLSNGLINLEIK